MTATKRDTPTDLLRAAERLFAEQGVDNVSLRQVAAAAGQANHSAVLYHFGDKSQFLNALLERHSDPIQAGWIGTVAHLEAEGRDSLREIIGVLVRPLVNKLDDPDGGTEYLLIVDQLAHSMSHPVTEMPATRAEGIAAISRALARHTGRLSPELALLRMLRVIDTLYGSIAAYHRLAEAGLELSREAFITDLVDTLEAIVGAGADQPGPSPA